MDSEKFLGGSSSSHTINSISDKFKHFIEAFLCDCCESSKFALSPGHTASASAWEALTYAENRGKLVTSHLLQFSEFEWNFPNVHVYLVPVNTDFPVNFPSDLVRDAYGYFDDGAKICKSLLPDASILRQAFG